MKQFVKTIDGTIEKRSKTRKIDGKFYIKGVQTVQVDGQWHRINNGKIIYDMDTNTWIKSSSGLFSNVKHKIIIQEMDNKYVYGIKRVNDPDFLFDLYVGVPSNAVHIGSVETIEEVNKLGFRSSKSDFFYYKRPEGLTNNNFLLHLNRKGVPVYKFPLQYNFSPENVSYQRSILSRHSKKSVKAKLKSSKQNTLNYFLNKFTFGLEFETASGAMPISTLINTGLIPLRDGSIKGHEYVTSPLSKGVGVANLIGICKELDKNTTVDQNCSLHVHVGGFTLTKIETVALYYLCVRLQNEIHEMIAPFKRDYAFLSKKDKDHTQLLNAFSLNSNSIIKDDGKVNNTELSKYLDRIWAFLTSGYASDHPDYGFNKFQHPLARSQKWNQPMRYFWVNMMPVLFNPGNNRTVEFRCHQATNKHFMVIPWLILCVSLIKYTKSNAKYILNNKNKISIKDIIDGISNNFDDKNYEKHVDGLRTIRNNMRRYHSSCIEVHSQRQALNKKSYKAYVNSIPDLKSHILGSKKELSFYEQK